eukprot:scaffold18824_cov49-Phaeocystis_antarctica.AAC.4
MSGWDRRWTAVARTCKTRDDGGNVAAQEAPLEIYNDQQVWQHGGGVRLFRGHEPKHVQVPTQRLLKFGDDDDDERSHDADSGRRALGAAAEPRIGAQRPREEEAGLPQHAALARRVALLPRELHPARQGCSEARGGQAGRGGAGQHGRGQVGVHQLPARLRLRIRRGGQDELMRIGHTSSSETFSPQVEDAAACLGAGYAFADCPGFLDNRGFEINVANAVNVRHTAAAASSAVVVVVINYYSLRADRGKGLHDLLSILLGLFGSAEQVRAHAPSVLLAISQAPVSHPETSNPNPNPDPNPEP